jgi:hypothetical protein
MWKLLSGLDLLAPAGATRNVAAAIDAHRRALAEADSVVDRLRRRVEADEPAA